jgi:hypothetical protein
LDHEYGIIRTLDFLHPTASRFLSPYIWHDGALRWQTPDIGAAQGVTPTVAALVKSHVNEDMARCILALYRSAPNLL